MRTVIVAAIMVLIWGTAVSAEFYRYKDRHGNVLYTDDLNKVPLEQRESVQRYDGSPETAVRAQEATEIQSGSDEPDLEAERQKLEQKEKELNREYEQLIKERDELDSEKDNAVTPDQIKAYNTRIENFNARIKAYEKEHGIHSENVKTFNDRLKSSAPERN